MGIFLQHKQEQKKLSESKLREAIIAVQGMMRFADHDNPLLLKALGDLLIYDENPTSDAKLLACRCYLLASRPRKDPMPYRELAEKALSLQTKWANSDQPISLGEVERNLEAELHEASLWYGELLTDERRWIRLGKNADDEFDRLYSAEPELPPSKTENQPTNWYIKIFPFVSFLCLALSLIATVLIYRRMRQTRSAL